MSQAWEYRGPGQYVDGVPYGERIEPGDHYIADTPITAEDVPLRAECPLVHLDEETGQAVCALAGVDPHVQLETRVGRAWLGPRGLYYAVGPYDPSHPALYVDRPAGD